MTQSLQTAFLHATAMESALRGYTSGVLSLSVFLETFREAFAAYSAAVDSKPYYPLAEIAAATLSRSYNGLESLCEQALDRLPRELLDRTTRLWITNHLIDSDGFNFTGPGGASHFGDMRQLYSTPIKRESFLLSALDGAIKPAPFNYENLLAALRTVAEGELATWALCTEPDNAFAYIDSLWSLGNAFQELEQLAKLEQLNARHVQGGQCYLLLIPASRNWLLVNSYDFSELSIVLHGDTQLLARVSDCLATETHR
ncbi:hypothetical protein [Lysobacter enzymogenes]|uniref:hypothetical protein n=1 Tax=Lysobacter enzymogenes TaxID=69 RepID=UPI001114357B|nr:hypothetical protein [Lysobacter enzymogenes]